MPLVFTPQMKKRLTPRVMRMLETSLREFPELEGKTLTVGYTRSYLGAAFTPALVGVDAPMGIWLRARNLVYNTIGHELTHLVQGLSHVPHKRASRPVVKIPGGEKQCDIWTLARSGLFCDDAPTYLKLPRVVRENWPRYAEPIAFIFVGWRSRFVCSPVGRLQRLILVDRFRPLGLFSQYLLLRQPLSPIHRTPQGHL